MTCFAMRRMSALVKGVVPSGAARATSAAPSVLLAPARFSITQARPSDVIEAVRVEPANRINGAAGCSGNDKADTAALLRGRRVRQRRQSNSTQSEQSFTAREHDDLRGIQLRVIARDAG
jgi:hypothetical protein